MENLISSVLDFTLLAFLVFLGFSFMYESMGEYSFFPDDLVLPAAVTRPVGIVLALAGTLAFVWQLIRLH